MKNILLFFFFFFSVLNYGQQLSANHLKSSTLESDDLFFEKAIISTNTKHGFLNIKNAVLDKITVLDTLGKLQKSFVFLTTVRDHVIDVSELFKGVYFIVLENENKTASRKIIIN